MTACARVLLTFALALILLPGAQAQTRKTVGPWGVVCSGGATGYCSASNRVKSVSGPYRFQLNVSRERPGVALEVALLTGYQHPRDGSPITVQVDAGKPLRLATGTGYRRAGRSNTFVVAAGETERLLQQMRAGQSVRFRFEDAKGAAVDATFSLSGLSGALAFMDKMQPAPRARAPAASTPASSAQPAPADLKPAPAPATATTPAPPISPTPTSPQERAPARTATAQPAEKPPAPVSPVAAPTATATATAPTPATTPPERAPARATAPEPAVKPAAPASPVAAAPATATAPTPATTPPERAPARATAPAPVEKAPAPASPVAAAPAERQVTPAPVPAPKAAPLPKEAASTPAIAPTPATEPAPAPPAPVPVAPPAREAASTTPATAAAATGQSGRATAAAPVPAAPAKSVPASPPAAEVAAVPAQKPAAEASRKPARAQQQAAVSTAPSSSRKRGAKSIRQFSCIGSGPLWTLVIDGDSARYAALTDAGQRDTIELAGKLNVTGDGPTPVIDWRGKSDWGGSFRAQVSEEACRDGTSGSGAQTDFEYKVQVSLPGRKTVRGCCNAGLPPAPVAAAPTDTTQFPVADLRNRPETDWSRYLFDLLPAIQACIDKTPEPEPYATKAWPMNQGMVGVRTRNSQGGWFECVADANGRSVERFIPLPAAAPPAPNENRVVFSPPDHPPIEDSCYKHERVLDGLGDFMGWLSTNGCS